MHRKFKPLHPKVRKALRCPPGMADAEVLSEWKSRTGLVCKPCWELKYCPYGPLVEQFPLPPLIRAEAESHDEYLRSCLASGRLADGRKLDPERRKSFEEELAWRANEDLPDELPAIMADVSCHVFGHICPVFFVAEPLTETRECRRTGRSIPRDVMLKVVRRDGQICQRCYEPVPDHEIEFDHIIPFSKGGPPTADNLRLVHRDCNRRKSDSLNEILAPDALIHFRELQKTVRTRQRKK